MLNPVIKEFQFGDQTVRIETGRIARQATGAAMVYVGDIAVLTTVVGVETARPGQAFFPLTVNYQEKTYAAGKIPADSSGGRTTFGKGDTDLPVDRPPHPPALPQGFHERGAGDPDSDVGGQEPGSGYCRHDRHVGGAGTLGYPLRRPDRRGAGGLPKQRIPAQSEPLGVAGIGTEHGGCRYGQRRAHGGVRSQ